MVVALIVLAAAPGNLPAQDGYIFTTLAGKAGVSGSTNGLNADARFKSPSGIAVVAGGGLVIGDSGNAVLRKISGSVVTTFAGLAGVVGTVDSILNFARFGAVFPVSGLTGLTLLPSGFTSVLSPTLTEIVGPQGIAVSANDTLFVVDTGNSIVRVILSGAIVTTIAGAPQPTQYSGTPVLLPPPRASTDGTGATARFVSPHAVAVAGDTLYVTDTNANTIRKIAPGNVVSTYAGSAGSLGAADGERLSARFRGPAGIAADSAGNIFVVDSNNYTIRQISPAGIVTTLAGATGQYGSTDGTGTQARFGGSPPAVSAGLPPTPNPEQNYVTSPRPETFGPVGLALDSVGNLLLTDTVNHTIRKITPGGVVTTVGGVSGSYGSADGPGRTARFNAPKALTVDASGNLYVADTGNHTIRKGTPAYLPQIVIQPRGQSVDPGQTVTLSVEATGTLPQTFEWIKKVRQFQARPMRRSLSRTCKCAMPGATRW